MIAKEWRDARWKFLIAIVLFLALVATNLLPREALVSNLTGDGLRSVKPAQVAMYASDIVFSTYMAGTGILIVLAAILGIGLISAEAGRGTIFLLLSKPVSRTRILLIKYGVAAVTLLTAAISGGVLLFIAAALRGYPLEQISVVGIALSALLMWLGVLFVLGVALLMSVLFRSIIASIAATAMVTYIILGPESWMGYSLSNELQTLGFSENFLHQITLIYYWFDGGLFMGENFAVTKFIVCLIAAAPPLLAALWLFNRRAY